MDFTVSKYRTLLEALSEAGYGFLTFSGFMESGNVNSADAAAGSMIFQDPTYGRQDFKDPTPGKVASRDPVPDRTTSRDPVPGSFKDPTPGKVVVLRHDVDLLPGNALRMARLEAEMGIAATYYFRIVPQSFDRGIIRAIHELGHEIGYHYEDLSLVSKSNKKQSPDVNAGRQGSGNDLLELAIDSFRRNLETMREVAPVHTACMHGSPLSRWNNRMIWDQYDYREYGIIGEPYFDVDYSRVWYITDTGRSWGRKDANVRDRVDSGFDIRIRSTDHLAALARAGELPEQIIINTHPQRWNDPGYRWTRELALQNVKNVLKSILIRFRRSE